MTELLDSKMIIKYYKKYFDDFLIKDIRAYQSDKLDYITIDLDELLTFEPDLVELILNDPKEQHKLIMGTLNTYKDKIHNKPFNVRYTNVNNFNKINLSHIRSKDLGKLISVKGMLKRKSTNLIKVTHIEYLCTNHDCAFSQDKLVIPQEDELKKELRACPRCKSPIEKVNERQLDYQQMYLEELSEDMEMSGMLPEAKLIEVYGQLTEPNFINQFLVGSKIEVIGIIKEKRKQVQGRESVVSNIYLEGINILSLDNDVTNVEITERDKKEFESLAKEDNVLLTLKNSIAPSIAGRDKIKEATLLYVVGGTKKDNGKDLIHLLTIGNASLAKSVMLRRLKELLPRTVYVSAENASAVGLVGAAVKDTLTGAWTLEAGAMPLANNGYFLLDEFDKIKKEDSTKLNEALEHQEAHINKAGIRGVLKAYTPCYAVANPIGGKFDESMDYAKQIKFDKTLLSRFDLIFILDGRDNDKENEDIIDLMLDNELEEVRTLDTEQMRKYLMYAKQFTPKLPNELKSLIKDYFLRIQRRSKEQNTLDITYRQLAGLVRLSEGYAKLHLRSKVIKQDVVNAIELMNFTLNKFGVSEIETGITSKTRNILTNIRNIIYNLDESNESITFQKILDKLNELNIEIDKYELERKMDDLKNEAIIFEPRKGIYKLTK